MASSKAEPRVLPAHPHLDHLKKQAKDLLEIARSGNADAVAEFKAIARPADARRGDHRLLTLASAQHAIARSYGFATWPALKQEVLRRSAERLRSDGLPADREQRMDLLDRALNERNLNAIRVLLELDATLADGWGQRRPIAVAAELNVPEAVDLLVDAGASLEPDSGYAHTPLSWAVTVGSLPAARKLAERGSPIDLWCAAGLGLVDRLPAFFDAQGEPLPGAARHGATRYDEAGKRLPKPPSDPVEIVSDALYIACRNGQLEAARLLLDRGADPAFRSYDDAPALHWAAASGNRALVDLLLERGADPHLHGGQFGSDYRQFAVRRTIEYPWSEGLRRVTTMDPTLVHERDERWGPPLNAAAEKGLDEHVKLLLAAGADPRAVDHAGRTPLDCAVLGEAVEGKLRVIALLEAASAPA